ncbi:PucR family transcriptional regulator [Rhodococcus sp. NPDC004095]
MAGMSAHAVDADVDARVSAIATVMQSRLPQITGTIREVLAAEIGELRDPPMLEMLDGSIEGNVDTVRQTLRYNISAAHLEASASAMEYARRLARHDVPVNALVRAYRLGQTVLVDTALGEIDGPAEDPEMVLRIARRIVTVIAAYADRISQQAVQMYETERERWLLNRNRVRALRVLELIADETAESMSIESSIGYPLRHNHLAFILGLSEDLEDDEGPARLEQCARRIARLLRSRGEPLFVAADRNTGWAWIPLGEGVDATRVVTAIRQFADRERPGRIAVGGPLPGVSGFRRSHIQADAARRVAVAAGPAGPTVTAFTDPGVATTALLVQDLTATRRWVRYFLGGLAADTPGNDRLRETLRVFLETGASNKAAAERLTLHYNTVKYRVQRAQVERGRPVGTDRLEVELALQVCHLLGDVVLVESGEVNSGPGPPLRQGRPGRSA